MVGRGLSVSDTNLFIVSSFVLTDTVLALICLFVLLTLTKGIDLMVVVVVIDLQRTKSLRMVRPGS